MAFVKKTTKAETTGIDLSRKVVGIEQQKEPDKYIFIRYRTTPLAKVNKIRRNPFILTCIDTVLINGKKRTIALVEGQDTVFKDEMTEDARLNLSKLVKRLKFYEDILPVNSQDKLTLQYLSLTDNNSNKEKRDNSKAPLFYMYAPEKPAMKGLVDDELIVKAKSYVYDNSTTEEGLTKLVQFSEVIGIVTQGRSYAEIKFDLVKLAEKSPKEFLDGLKNPNNKHKHVVLEAIKTGVIKKTDNRLHWTDNNVDLIVAPIGIDPVDMFVSKSFDELKDTFSYLEDRVMQQPIVV